MQVITRRTSTYEMVGFTVDANRSETDKLEVNEDNLSPYNKCPTADVIKMSLKLLLQIEAT